MKTLSVIVPVHNQLQTTKKFVDSVLSQGTEVYEEVQIVFIDNASDSDTIYYLKTLEDIGPISFLCIKNDENVGFAKAVNQGMKLVSDDKTTDILVTNNDIEFLPGCWDALYNCAYSADNIGVVGGQLLFPDGKVQHAGAWLNVFGWGQHKGAMHRMDAPFFVNKREDQEYVTGALFFIKNKAFIELGYFDEQFSPAFFEETDYCYRAHVAGWRVVYEPTAKAIHHESVTGKAIYKDQQRLKRDISDINQVKFYSKWRHLEFKEDEEREHKILLRGKIYGGWSFSHTLSKLAIGLDNAGVDVSIASDEYHATMDVPDWRIKKMIMKPNDYWNRVILRHSEGDHMYVMPPGKKRIGYLALESSKLNPLWVPQLNHLDQLLAVSPFVKGVIEQAGVTTPIEVLPNCVDTSRYNEEVTPLEIAIDSNTFTFYSVFSFGDRKSPDVLFRAFIEEFGPDDNVSLVVHSLSMFHIFKREGVDVKGYLDSFVPGKVRAPIYVTSDYMDDRVIPSFIKNFDVFVLPSKAEGFGLPILEAMACGQPTIITGYSGPMGFTDNNTSWYIDYDLVDIPLQYLTYFKNYIGGQWAEPKVGHLRQLMRYAYEHQDEAKAKGKAAAIKAKEYDMNVVGKKAKQLIFGE